MNKNIIIFGTGDIAQIASYYFQTDTDRNVEAFTVDSNYINRDVFEGMPIVAFEDVEKKYPPERFDMFIAVSYSDLNKFRESKYFEAKSKGYRLASYISSSCTYLSQFAPGDNCFIFEDNTIQPFVRVGNNVTLWSGNHVGHHSIIHDHVFISSHVVISGHCVVESNAFIGVNATLHNGITIGGSNIIGAGAIVSKSTQPFEVWLPERSHLYRKKSNEIQL